MKHVFPALIFLGGLLLPIGLLKDEMVPLIVTFFGLLSAGIIPALSLLVSSTLSSSLSIRRLMDLKGAIDTLVSRLLQTLLFLVVGAVALFWHEYGVFQLPENLGQLVLPQWAQTAPERFVQAIVLMSFVVGIDRLRLVGYAFKSVLQEKFDLALSDSEKRIRANANQLGSVQSFYPKSDGFGDEVVIEVPKEEDAP